MAKILEFVSCKRKIEKKLDTTIEEQAEQILE